MFEDLPDPRSRGRAGEDEAESFLRAQGFAIVARNVVTRAGELDLIATEGETLCFVEVKARRSSRYGPAICFVTPAKQRRLARAAALYLTKEGIGDREVRFDVLGLERHEGCWKHILIRNAFAATDLLLV